MEATETYASNPAINSSVNYSFFTPPKPSAYDIAASFTIGSVGVLANGFVLIVLIGFTKIKYGLSTILLIHQTVTDTVCSAFILLSKGLSMTDLVKYTGVFGEIGCRILFNNNLFWMSFTASSYSIVSITLERYLVIVHPVFHRNHFTKRVVKALIILCWTLAALCIFPVILIFSIQDGTCVAAWPSQTLDLVYLITVSVVHFILPVTFFVFAYGRMIWVLRMRNKISNSYRSGMADNAAMGKSQLNMTMTMIVVAMVYIICLSPNQIYSWVTILTRSHNAHFGSRIYFSFMILSLMNCCINPFIYAVKYNAFKTGIRRMLKLEDESVRTTETATSSH